MTSPDKIYFENNIQAALYDQEFRGQLSDGHWENSRPLQHETKWWYAEALVDPHNPGRNFGMQLNGKLTPACRLANQGLIAIVGDRMLEICQKIAGPSFTHEMMMAEIRKMDRVIRTHRKAATT